jgi:hypothetical protein
MTRCAEAWQREPRTLRRWRHDAEERFGLEQSERSFAATKRGISTTEDNLVAESATTSEAWSDDRGEYGNGAVNRPPLDDQREPFIDATAVEADGDANEEPEEIEEPGDAWQDDPGDERDTENVYEDPLERQRRALGTRVDAAGKALAARHALQDAAHDRASAHRGRVMVDVLPRTLRAITQAGAKTGQTAGEFLDGYFDAG